MQTELIRLLILQQQAGQQEGQHPGPHANRFVEGELEAYRRLMRDFLGRDLRELGHIDWRHALVRRAVRDAHEQTKAVLLRRTDILEAGTLTPTRLARYLEVLCDRLLSPNGKPSGSTSMRVDVEAADLGLDTAIYCVLIVNEIVQDALAAGASPPVSVALSSDSQGVATLAIALEPTPASVTRPPTPVLSALIGEIGGSLA